MEQSGVLVGPIIKRTNRFFLNLLETLNSGIFSLPPTDTTKESKNGEPGGRVVQIPLLLFFSYKKAYKFIIIYRIKLTSYGQDKSPSFKRTIQSDISLDRIVVLHEIANLGPLGLAGSIPARGVHTIENCVRHLNKI